ncbi:MAG: thioredoxin family protein [Fluviicola sp.]|nr:thioredoxin family protein [Fluviicola sp.]
MKYKLGFLVIALLSVFIMTSISSDEEEGIKFEHATLAEAKVMAKESGKIIFIDCYTDWCGPCRKMAATSFKNKKVGDLYNKSFINLKIEMEKNPDGREISKMYKINAYPTLLMIDAEGKLIKKAVGMHKSGHLIQLANVVLEK